MRGLGAASYRPHQFPKRREIDARVSVLPFSTEAQLNSSPKPPPPPPPKPISDSSSPILRLVSLLRETGPDDWRTNSQLHEFFHSSPSPNSVLQIARQLGSAEKAQQFFDFFKAQTSPSSPDSFSLSLAFQAIIEHSIRETRCSPTKLYELFCSAKQQNISLSINAAMMLIRCFVEARMFEESLSVFYQLGPESKNMNVVNRLLDALVRGGRLDGALKMLDEMLQPDMRFPPNENTMEIFLSAIWRSDWRGMSVREGEISGLVSRFGEHGLFPNDIWLSKLITKFCRSGRCDIAWDLLHHMIRSGCQVKTGSCNALLAALGREHDFQKMNMLTNEMKEKGIAPNVVTFGILINHLCKLHRVDEALQVFEKMRGASEGISIEPDTVIYNTLIDGLCKVGRQEEGVGLMEKMRLEKGCTPNTVTFNCLIDGFCKAGEIERSIKLFYQMTEDGIVPNIITFNTLLDGMCKHGRVGSAMEFFTEMQEKGLKGNAISYSILITAFCSANNIEKAVKLFSEMTESGCYADAVVYYSLISGLSQAGRMDDACLVLSRMKEAGFFLDVTGYNILIGGFCRRNKWEKVHELLQEMEQAGINPDCVTYNTLISFFSKKGEFARAHRLLKKMVGDGMVPTVITYGALIHAYCVAGKLDEAMKLFETMHCSSKLSPNTAIYNSLIESLCKSDKVEDALSLMNDMKDKGVRPNTTTYNSIFKGLQERNWFERAFEVMDEMTANLCNPDYVTMEILTGWLSAIGQSEKLQSFVQGYQVSA
nr:pentatricopeptide repeat-containing protein At3g61520, mitochondrial-like [Ipomoea batatas]